MVDPTTTTTGKLTFYRYQRHTTTTEVMALLRGGDNIATTAGVSSGSALVSLCEIS